MFSRIQKPAVLAAALFATIAIQAAAHATTRDVPSASYPTIQSAINAAVSGDTVRVAAGTYHESLDWQVSNVMNLMIQGAGADKTFIDPSIANGGPGGYCVHTKGLDSNSHIDGFTFQNGSAGKGGGMFNDVNSSPTVTNCVFRDNAATDSGGGMYNYYFSSPTVTGCTFQNGRAAGAGGGMVNSVNSSPTITNCVFIGNSANVAGAMYNENASSPTITNCTFTGNTAGFTGGMYNYNFSNPTITNCILWGNNGEIFDNGTSSTVTYTDLQGTPNPSNGNNFGADPLFVRNPFTNGATDYGDLRLQASSPCINVGANSAVPADVTTDLAGNPRIADGTIDLGAYEFTTNTNHAPVADAGMDQTVEGTGSTTTVTLDGGGSSDPDGDALTYQWSEGGTALPNGNTASPNVSLPLGVHILTLTVTDPSGASDSDDVVITVQDTTAPTTSASPSGTTTTTTVTLSASDTCSGVNVTYYRIDGGEQQTYTAPFTLSQGLHSVQYWSVDNADNVETFQYLPVDTRVAVTVAVDKVSGKRGGKVNLSATVILSGTRTKLSGLSVLFVLDGTTFAGSTTTNKQGVASLSWTIPAGFAVGSHTIQATFPGTNLYNSNSGTGTLTAH